MKWGGGRMVRREALCGVFRLWLDGLLLCVRGRPLWRSIFWRKKENVISKELHNNKQVLQSGYCKTLLLYVSFHELKSCPKCLWVRHSLLTSCSFEKSLHFLYEYHFRLVAITNLLLVFWSHLCCCCCCWCGCDGASVHWLAACPVGGHLPACSDLPPASLLVVHLEKVKNKGKNS